jgi:demethylmenaquinone methyltransferase/2-methoxy-6-polyprenyl-1,4-benzoquinol methylase
MSAPCHLIAEQLEYYRAIAGEYDDHAIDVPGQHELLTAIDAFLPTGDVLELACGTGTLTEHLIRSA